MITLNSMLAYYIAENKWLYFIILSAICILQFLKEKNSSSSECLSNKQSTGHMLKFLALFSPICILVVPIVYNLIIFFMTHSEEYTDLSAEIRLILNSLYIIFSLLVVSIAIYRTHKNILTQRTLLTVIHISGLTCVYMLGFQLVTSVIPYIWSINYTIWGKFLVISNDIKLNIFSYMINFILLIIFMSLNKYYKKKQFNINDPSAQTTGHFGTAKWADEPYLKEKGLYNPNNTLIGSDEKGRILKYPICNRTIIANSGGGKSSGCLIPALLTEDRPVFCFDPKGELWAVTAKHRATGFGRNRKVITIDPFQLIQRKDLSKNKSVELRKKYQVNPLDYISKDPKQRDRQLTNIASSCVVRDEKAHSQHWFDYAEIFIKGVIEYILDTAPADKINLITVREFLLNDKTEMFNLITAMHLHGGKHARATAAMLQNIGDEEKGSIWSTTYRQLSWVIDENTMSTFNESNIDLRDFIKGDMDIFVILPEDQIQEHSRVIRLIFTSIINILSQTESSDLPKNKFLFILDELGQLGASKDVQRAIEILRYKQVIIWAVFQNYGQIKLYQKPESFLEAQIKQFFSTDDVNTMEWIQKLAGQKTIRVNSLAQNTNIGSHQSNLLNTNITTGDNISVQETGVPLLHLNQIREMNQDFQFVFVKGIRPIMCKRIFYYKDAILNSFADSNPYIISCL
jgi:type IV secretion system protein VirD4